MPATPLRPPHRLRAALLVAAVLLGVAAPLSHAAQPAPPSKARPTVVVALTDTGVNPYHEVFFRPRNTAHPCTWVPGFTDCSIPALELSIGKYRTYEKAYAADAHIWADLDPGQWYWIPRTNIIGAVCDTVRGGDATKVDATCILDDEGHGTGTASSVLSEAPDALLIVEDGKSTARGMQTAPVIPDVRSHSWGPAAPLPLHAADASPGDDSICDPDYAPQTVFFLAAGNEAPYPTLLDCERQNLDLQVVGGSYPGYWNYNSWSAYDFASWFCRPVAMHGSLHDYEESCGTSFAAPTAAGTAADAILRIRRHDRHNGRSTPERVSTSVTRDDFILALRNGATYDPQPKYPVPSATSCTYVFCYVGWAPMTPGQEYMYWGYGWLDSTVTQAVVDCALRRSCPAKSAEAKAWNERRQEARRTTSDDAATPFPQDDAGSKRDAGRNRHHAVRISADQEYASRLEPYGVSGDMEDWYVFRAVAGQKITLTASAYAHPAAMGADAEGVVACWTLYDPSGRLMGTGDSTSMYTYGCSTTRDNVPPEDVLAEQTGTYALVYSSHNGLPAHDYEFMLSLAS